MDKSSNSEQMAHDDIFFSLIVAGMGIYFSHQNWIESDWWGLFGTALLGMFGFLWFSLRVYHLKHKDEVFGESEDDSSELDKTE